MEAKTPIKFKIAAWFILALILIAIIAPVYYILQLIELPKIALFLFGIYFGAVLGMYAQKRMDK